MFDTTTPLASQASLSGAPEPNLNQIPSPPTTIQPTPPAAPMLAVPQASPSGSGLVIDVLADVEPTAKPVGTVNNQQLTGNIKTMSLAPPPISTIVNSQLPNVNSQPAKPGGFAGLWQTKKWLVIGAGLLVLIGVAAAVSAYLGTFSGGAAPEEQATNQAPQDQGVAQQPAQNPAVAPLSTPETGLPNDDDRDSLTNDEERKLGTNPEVADTDGDGLSDYEEVKVYATDPLKADTDGDGYKDGDEVINGYNPKGSGKLTDFQNELKKLNNNASATETSTTPAASSAPSNGLPTNATQ